ncbi:MAG: cell wall metabolism sensor histidine kinase WalK [Defluviitaleaceae bacterium]|nr:cell wall metabolism sensor histidine kinase WalK [Defluviitaleaceae bacterium]
MFEKIKWYNSLKWKLLAILLIIGIVPVFFFQGIISNAVSYYFVSQRQRELMRVANITADIVQRNNYLVANREALQNTMYLRSEEEDVRILILDSSGMVISDSSNIEDGNFLIMPEVVSALRGTIDSNIQGNGGAIRYTAAPIFYGDIVKGVVLIVSAVQNIDDLIDLISTQANIMNFVTAGFSLAAAFLVSYLISAPLTRMIKVVIRMSEGHLDQRIEVTGNNEFSQLCTAFNNMNDKLERVEQTREEFVSNVSHELKTPLSAIKVLSESILHEENVEKETYIEFLTDINSEIDRMDQIINNLLTLVRLDQSKSFLNISDIDVNLLMQNIVKRLRPLADIKNITLYREDLKEAIVRGDELKLTLALGNLVENAIKYTPEGGEVKVTVDADHQHIFVSVSDTGIGIPEEEQPKIFTRFYRVDKTRDRDTGGTGLGLSITHTTVLMHKGSIKVTSAEGEGSTFLVRLPI